ncbi:MAG: nuclease A inhibitor family protein [Acidobacteriota bacterium]
MQNFFQENNKKGDGLFRKIEAACDGLIYTSETDAPVVAFSGPEAAEPTGELILQQIGGEAEAGIEEVRFGDFFGKLTAIRDWYGEPQKERAKRFLDLQQLLEENLRLLKVFRIGEIRIDIYTVGITDDGRMMGVSTKAVET